MKRIALLLAGFATVVSSANLLAKGGLVRFYSTTPLENIEGTNTTAVSSLDLTTGTLAIKALNTSFIFPNKLMQEHFNENYMESGKYPTSTFSGKVIGLDRATLDSGKSAKVTVDGILQVHGVPKHYQTTGSLQKNADGSIHGETTFYVKIADHGIKIPSVVMAKIADSMEITSRFNWHSAETAK